MGRQFAPGTAGYPDVIREGAALACRATRPAPRTTPRNPIPGRNALTW